MAGLKKRLSSYLKDKLGITELQHRLKEQLNFQMSLLNFASPEVLKIPHEVLAMVQKDLREKYDIDDFHAAIHKNDIMFQHHLYHHPDIAEALKHYFRVGASISRELCGIFEIHASGRILDFGAGYGRLTRFLPSCFPSHKIIASEVKPHAVAFLENELGIDAFIHKTDPQSFPDTRFDGILALSVFTHLPQPLFEAWFKKLAEQLSPNGAFLLSFNDANDHGKKGGEDFYYSVHSEDSFFRTSDRLASEEEYGLSFVSRNYLSQLAEDSGLIIKFITPKTLGTQSLAYCAKKS